MDARPDVYDRNRNNYLLLLILSVAFIALSVYTNERENLILAIPTLVLTIIAFHRKDDLYIPPLFIVMLVITMVLLQLTKFFKDQYSLIYFVADYILGMFVCLIGLMIILAILKTSPDFDVEKPFFVSFTAFCIGVTLSLALFMLDYGLDMENSGPSTIRDLLIEILTSMLGAITVATLFYMNRHNNLFKHTLDKFLTRNADTLNIDRREHDLILSEIEAGESSKLEFKSTLRTNLKTGEKDPRMEKAVLKTIVAFLNSRGGTLLIGVADDGTILGVDLESFENSKDKFGLHLNNLITKQIGGEFLPFINYALTDFDGKSVMRVVCKRSDRPVFLDDGKEQLFYVRSGPSSIDLHGTDLLYYAHHNYGKSLNKKS